ncbi:hypothetical protein OO012_17760 [Rhodobacteraceae bacterium KMM 6894]|nr:hypothetical protein [Rhodobacteraceae bacterium KMM 6894]
MTENLGPARHRLIAEREANPEAPARVPKTLPLKKIETEPTLFQPRGYLDKADTDQGHVAGIAQGIGDPEHDDPLDVWWTGRRFVLLDGHHRLAAYARRQETTGATQKVPVRVHAHMTFEGAEALSARLNTRDKLAMSYEDKVAVAWRMVCFGNGSKVDQHRASSLSKGTIGNMRAVHGRLIEMGRSVDSVHALGWAKARRLDRGDTDWEYTDDDLERRAEEIALGFAKVVGVNPTANPEAIAMALKLWSKALPSLLLQSYSWEDDLKSVGRERLKEINDEEDEIDEF